MSNLSPDEMRMLSERVMRFLNSAEAVSSRSCVSIAEIHLDEVGSIMRLLESQARRIAELERDDELAKARHSDLAEEVFNRPQPETPSVQPDHAKLCAALTEALQHARVPGFETRDGSEYPFVDLMSDDGKDISTGISRINDFAETVTDAVLDLLEPSVPPSTVKDSLTVQPPLTSNRDLYFALREMLPEDLELACEECGGDESLCYAECAVKCGRQVLAKYASEYAPLDAEGRSVPEPSDSHAKP